MELPLIILFNGLKKHLHVAETDMQKKELDLLIDYYKTGDLKKWDEYNVAWARNSEFDG